MVAKKKAAEVRGRIPIVAPPLPDKVMPPGSLPDDQMTHVEVSLLCLFTCPRCNFETDSWQELFHHLTPCIGNNAFSTDYIKEARYHKCAICKCCILGDFNFISGHYKATHKISRKDQYLQICREKPCVGKTEKPGTVQARLVAKTHSAFAGNRLSSSEKATVPQQARKECSNRTFDLAVVPRSLIARNLCQFKCLCCGKTFDSSLLLREHRRRGRPCQGAVLLDVNVVIKIVSYECGLCKRLLLCDEQKLKEHLRRVHRTTKKQYFAEVGQRTENETRIERLRQSVPVVPVFGLYSVSPPSAIPRDKVTREVENLCIFQCPKCNSKFDVALTFLAHKKSCMGSTVTR